MFHATPFGLQEYFLSYSPFCYAADAVAENLDGANVGSLFLAVATHGNVEFYLCAFVERLKARSLDFREMNEQIFALILGNETITLFGVEPLYGTLRHVNLMSCPHWVKSNNAADCRLRQDRPLAARKRRKSTSSLTATQEQVQFHARRWDIFHFFKICCTESAL